VHEHGAQGLPLVGAAGDRQQKDVSAKGPGVLGPLEGRRDNVQRIVAVLPSTRRGDLDLRATSGDDLATSIVKSAAARPLTGTPPVSVTETTRYNGSLLPGLATPCAAPSAAVPRASTIRRAISNPFPRLEPGDEPHREG
jgi:hypothetical protein